MSGFVYILADMRRGRTYIGVTNDLIRRVHEDREGPAEGYTRTNTIKRLVYFEQHDAIINAIQREKSLKRWYRHWKEALIEEVIRTGAISGTRSSSKEPSGRARG